MTFINLIKAISMLFLSVLITFLITISVYAQFATIRRIGIACTVMQKLLPQVAYVFFEKPKGFTDQ